MRGQHANRGIYLLPVLGVIFFIILYIIAASLYPGGSFLHPLSSGYNWKENYWCELLAPKAKNGNSNTSRPVAIIAMSVLALTLVYFWYQLPLLFPGQNKSSLIIRAGGIGSMLVMPFMLFGNHDFTVNLAGLLGFIALSFTLVSLFKNRMILTGIFTAFCMLLCLLNNYIYYSGHYISSLALIQKFTFLTFLSWFSVLSIRLYRAEP